MRIYKPAYTKAIPAGAKVSLCKTGPHKGKQVCKYKSKGETVQARLTKSGEKILVETKVWCIEFDDVNDIRRKMKAYTNETASKRLADRIEDLLNCQRNNRQPDSDLCRWIERLPSTVRADLISFKMIDTTRSAAGKTLTELTDDFELSMQAKERNPQHILQTVRSWRRICEGCRFTFWTDILPVKVEAYLKDLRDNGISYRRSNAYLQSAKHFCRWMVESDYVSESPLRHLKPLNVELDRRKERRAATPDEMRRLLDAARSGPVRCGMSGNERYALYLFAVSTGLRANEIRSLTVGSFDFDELTVTVKAGHSKHRREDVQPLKPEVAATLKDFFRGKLSSAKAFGGTLKELTERTAEIIKADLKSAGISYVDEDGKIFDFHALRHSFITSLRNVPARVAQALARHASSAMTDRYTHVRIHDERGALDTLPDLTKQTRTGTDG